MIESGQRKGIDHTSGRTCEGIEGAEHQARDARMHHGAGAHDARLQSDIEGRASETIIARRDRGRAQGGDLRMRGGIVQGNGLIAAFAHEGIVFDEHRTDRYLALRRCRARELQRTAKPIGVARYSQSMASKVLRTIMNA